MGIFWISNADAAPEDLLHTARKLAVSVRGIDPGQYADDPDVTEIQGDALHNIRDIVHAVKYRPEKGPQRVLLVHLVEGLSYGARTALEKTLEAVAGTDGEPARHLAVIVTSKEAVPERWNRWTEAAASPA